MVMDVTLPADLTKQVEQELVNGHYRSRDELIEQAVRHFFDERKRGQQRGQQRLDALRRIGQTVDQAGLYERVLIPGQGPVRNSWSWMPASSPTFLCAIRSCGSPNQHACSSRNGQRRIIRETTRTLESKLGWPSFLTAHLEAELRPLRRSEDQRLQAADSSNGE
jgi:Arc/MetJ-type ribon-helix-helix transcriptional regulator